MSKKQSRDMPAGVRRTLLPAIWALRVGRARVRQWGHDDGYPRSGQGPPDAVIRCPYPGRAAQALQLMIMDGRARMHH